MPKIDINGTVVDFPDNLSADELNKAAAQAATQIKAPDTTPAPSSFRDKVASVAKDMYQHAPEIAGATVGGVLAAPAMLTGAPGVALDAGAQGAGAAIGSMAKSDWQMGSNLIDQVQGNPPTYPNAPQTTGQVFGEAGKQAALGAGGALIAKPIGEALAPVADKLSSILKPAAIDGVQAIKDAFAKYGGQFLPSQVTKSGAIDFLENFIGSTFTGSEPIRVLHEANEKAVHNMAGDIADKLVNTLNQPGLEEGAKAVIQGITDGEAAHAAAAKPLYDRVDELMKSVTDTIQKPTGKIFQPTKDPLTGDLIPGNPETVPVETIVSGPRVSTLPQKQLVQDFLTKLRSGSIDKSGPTVVSGAVQHIADIVQNLKDNLSFGEAQTVRTQLGRKAADMVANQAKDTEAMKLYSALTGSISRQMDTTASQLNPEAMSAWQTANDFYRNGKQVFNNDLISKVVEKDPVLMGRGLFQGNNLSQLRAVKTALNTAGQITENPQKYADLYTNLLQGHWDELMSKMTNPSTGDLNGSSVLKYISDPKTAEVLKEAYGPLFPKIQEFAKVADLVSQKAAGKGGGIAGALSQVGAGKDILGAINPVADNQHRGRLLANGVSLLFAPMGLAKMMTTPEGLDAITTGFRAPLMKGAKNIATAMGQLVSHAIKAGVLDNGQQNDQDQTNQ